MNYAISVTGLEKIYDNGFQALKNINLNVAKGEIFALLGPNGAGKTTLIGTICGIVTPSGGNIEVFGLDHIKQYRAARAHIGLVPQELSTDAFETVINTVKFSRGLFGKAPSDDYIEELLVRLSLLDKKNTQIRKLSGGMKRRVMIAKALSHQPDILFLDEPSAGVDVELRKSMWQQVKELKEMGVTIILTTHYIEEAEEIADHIGVINNGQIVIIDEKKNLMRTLGKKELVISMPKTLEKISDDLSDFKLHLSEDKKQLILTYDPAEENDLVYQLLSKLNKSNIKYCDIDTRQTSLEEIFVQLVGRK